MKFNSAIAAALLSVGVSAFPHLPTDVYTEADRLNLVRRAEAYDILEEPDLAKRQASAASLSKSETNCGPNGPCGHFNKKTQYVSTSGEYAFTAPSASDIRGPCPGLNAAANHGYLPRSGVASISETIVGLNKLYSMSVDLGGFLAVYAVVLDGDIITQTWSIGGPPPFVNPVGSLLTPPQGISYSHNKYEGDTSIGRNDAYLNNGDAFSLNTTRFGYAYQTGMAKDRYTLDLFRQDVGNNQLRSIAQNPYYFAPLFSTTLVAPAAYNFVINFMSNHSAKEPNGYLNGAIFKEFFSVTGDYDASAESSGFGFTWKPGYERIPDNWYKRPESDEYNAPDVLLDLAIGWAAYPDTFRFGGNTNGVNSYEGVDIATLTGGSYTANGITKPKNFACLLFQTQQQAIPDELKGGINAVAASLKLINGVSGFLSKAGCPKLAKYDSSVFNQYPGHSYSPTAPTNNGGK